MNLSSSIAKKQTVAATGVLLILFVITHLAGNLFIYGGPGAYNSYAHRLHSLGALLWIARLGLLIVFLTHVSFTALLILENIKARGGLKRYEIDKPVGNRSWTERFMTWSGLYLFLFIIFHILNFAAANQEGPDTYIHGIGYGLYGLVYNYFTNPIHDALYILAMFFLGMHLSHGVQSLVQTSGFRPRWVCCIQRISNYFAIIMSVGFASIPVYVYMMSH